MTDDVPWTEARDDALERLVGEASPREFYGFREQLLEACADVIASYVRCSRAPRERHVLS